MTFGMFHYLSLKMKHPNKINISAIKIKGKIREKRRLDKLPYQNITQKVDQNKLREENKHLG